MKKIALVLSLTLLVILTSCTKETKSASKLKGVWEELDNSSGMKQTLEFSKVKKDAGELKVTNNLTSDEFKYSFLVKEDGTILNIYDDSFSENMEIVELSSKTLKLKNSSGPEILVLTKK